MYNTMTILGGIALCLFIALCCYSTTRIVWKNGFTIHAVALLLFVASSLVFIYGETVTLIIPIKEEYPFYVVFVIALLPVALFLLSIVRGIAKKEKEDQQNADLIDNIGKD